MTLKLFTRFEHLVKPPICHLISTHFLSSKSKIRVSDYLINHHQFSPETASRVSSRIPYVKDLEKPNAVLSYLKESGFSKSQMEKVFKRAPRVLCADLNMTIKPKIKIFQDLGFSQTDILDIISRDSWLIFRSVDNSLAPSILLLRRILGSGDELRSMLRSSSWVLSTPLERTVIPNIEFLKSCGISSTQIIRFLIKFQRFFVCKPENMECFVKRVDEMGVNRESKMFLYATRIISSMTMKKWEDKTRLFNSFGFTEDVIGSMFRRFPDIFSLSEKKLTEVMKVLLSNGNIDISYVARFPVLFSLSVERRLKPRLKVLKVLEESNLLKRKPSLSSVCIVGEKVFLDRYVIPYSNELRGYEGTGQVLSELPKMWLDIVGKHIAVA